MTRLHGWCGVKGRAEWGRGGDATNSFLDYFGRLFEQEVSAVLDSLQETKHLVARSEERAVSSQAKH